MFLRIFSLFLGLSYFSSPYSFAETPSDLEDRIIRSKDDMDPALGDLLSNVDKISAVLEGDNTDVQLRLFLYLYWKGNKLQSLSYSLPQATRLCTVLYKLLSTDDTSLHSARAMLDLATVNPSFIPNSVRLALINALHNPEDAARGYAYQILKKCGGDLIKDPELFKALREAVLDTKSKNNYMAAKLFMEIEPKSAEVGRILVDAYFATRSQWAYDYILKYEFLYPQNELLLRMGPDKSVDEKMAAIILVQLHPTPLLPELDKRLRSFLHDPSPKLSMHAAGVLAQKGVTDGSVFRVLRDSLKHANKMQIPHILTLLAQDPSKKAGSILAEYARYSDYDIRKAALEALTNRTPIGCYANLKRRRR